MNGIYLYFVNTHHSRWPLLGLQSLSIVQFLTPPPKKKRVTKIIKICLRRVKNVAKGENTGNWQFLLSPLCFKKVIFFKAVSKSE